KENIYVCTHCQSEETYRRIGRVAVAKGEDARMDALADEAYRSGVDENDPKSLGRFMKNMSRDMGEDLGDDFNEVVDRLEKGESPESIESSIPD
ncbi:MAG: zinc ribbon domain-containing protein, partial [Chloroflexota bacterium]